MNYYIMKKYSLSLLIACITLGGLLVSCSKDTSTMDLKNIEGVIIDTTGMPELSVYQFEELRVEPNLKTSIPEGDLSYEWYINLQPNDTVYQLLGEERNLETEIEFRPNVAGSHHQLLYTVTDNTTGLEYLMAWPLTVRNNIGEGLVIAETPDGVNTDLSHIMSPEVTPDYEGESIKHGVYSRLNGAMLPGLVKQMKYFRIYGVDAILAITDENIYRINTLDYTFGGMNDDLFFASSPNSPQTLDWAPQSEIIVYDGKLTATYLGAARRFGMPFDSDYVVPDHIAVNPFSYYPLAVRLNFFDETNQQFIYQPSVSQFGDRVMRPIPNIEDGAFDPTAVINKVNVAAEVRDNGDFLHLLKDTETGKLTLYLFDAGESIWPDTFAPAPKAEYDLSTAPGIENATEFVFLNNQSVMYYVSGNTLYAMLYGNSTPIFEERFTIPAGEEVTTLQVYQQANYPAAEEYLTGNNRQLIMSTYDGSEGKIYLLPFVNTGVANIDSANIKIFTGFDRITAITTQL